ncbi:MAG: hypothetical protein JKX73_00485 [Flavobacteriales bacterium]|nr:hypothetical protein [Flavobacteriales bacterium]
MLHLFFVLLLGVSSGSVCLSQSFNFKTFSTDDGLGASQISALFQDSKGVIWIGSNGGGLTRFDGQTFTVYTVEDGLVDNAVNEILEDDQHNLWICTANGVSKLSVETNALQAAEFVNYGVADGLADGPEFSSNFLIVLFVYILAFAKRSCRNVGNQEKNGTRFHLRSGNLAPCISKIHHL